MGYVIKAGLGKPRLDYVACENWIALEYGECASFVFNSQGADGPTSAGLWSFYEQMRARGAKVSLQPMSRDAEGTLRQRRVDVDIGSHLVWLASLPQIKTLVLTTGDQDLIPAVNMARAQLEKRVILFAYDSAVHHELAGAASQRLYLEREGVLR
jgi:uncharacterized LabA/DUF88 family protein